MKLLIFALLTNLAMTGFFIYKTRKPYTANDILAAIMCLLVGVFILIYATIKELIR